jgi:hypothetical protein
MKQLNSFSKLLRAINAGSTVTGLVYGFKFSNMVIGFLLRTSVSIVNSIGLRLFDYLKLYGMEKFRAFKTR